MPLQVAKTLGWSSDAGHQASHAIDIVPGASAVAPQLAVTSEPAAGKPQRVHEPKLPKPTPRALHLSNSNSTAVCSGHGGSCAAGTQHPQRTTGRDSTAASTQQAILARACPMLNHTASQRIQDLQAELERARHEARGAAAAAAAAEAKLAGVSQELETERSARQNIVELERQAQAGRLAARQAAAAAEEARAAAEARAEAAEAERRAAQDSAAAATAAAAAAHASEADAKATAADAVASAEAEQAKRAASDTAAAAEAAARTAAEERADAAEAAQHAAERREAGAVAARDAALAEARAAKLAQLAADARVLSSVAATAQVEARAREQEAQDALHAAEDAYAAEG